MRARWGFTLLGALVSWGYPSCAASKCAQTMSASPLLPPVRQHYFGGKSSELSRGPAYTFPPNPIHPLIVNCTRVRFWNGISYRLTVTGDGGTLFRFFYRFLRVIIFFFANISFEKWWMYILHFTSKWKDTRNKMFVSIHVLFFRFSYLC